MGNSRFKFRVFDKEENKIIDFNDFKKGDIEFNFNPDTQEIWIEYDKSRYIIIQSTDLKDKNGTLIFEGDVVKCPTFSEDTYIIDYSSGEYFCNINGRYGSGYSIQVITEHHNDFIEVIGNIYENENLLEQEES